MKRSIIAAGLVLALSGCMGSSAAPKWYSQHKQDNAQYIYGAGEGPTKMDAINNALSFAASKVSVTINSTFATSKQYIESNDESNMFRELSKQTTSKVKNIEFSDYNVVKSTKEGDKYYVLIKIDKAKNAQMLYNKAKNDINDIQQYLNIDDKVQILTKYPKLIARIKKDIYNLYTAQTLKNIPGINDTIKKAMKIKAELEQKLQSTSISIESSNSKMKNILEDIFSNMGYSLGSGVNVKADIRESRRQIGSYYLTTLSVYVTMKDKTSVQFGVKCAGKSVSDYNTAKEMALQSCKRKLEYKIKKILSR